MHNYATQTLPLQQATPRPCQRLATTPTQHAHILTVPASYLLPEIEVWTCPRSASPEQGVSAGLYEQRVSVEAPVHSSAIYGHHVAMVSFPYDDTPSPWIQYRIVVKNGHKIFQKELGAPACAPPTPAYRLRWAYVRNARMDQDCHPEGGVAMLQPLR